MKKGKQVFVVAKRTEISGDADPEPDPGVNLIGNTPRNKASGKVVQQIEVSRKKQKDGFQKCVKGQRGETQSGDHRFTLKAACHLISEQNDRKEKKEKRIRIKQHASWFSTHTQIGRTSFAPSFCEDRPAYKFSNVRCGLVSY